MQLLQHIFSLLVNWWIDFLARISMQNTCSILRLLTHCICMCIGFTFTFVSKIEHFIDAIWFFEKVHFLLKTQRLITLMITSSMYYLCTACAFYSIFISKHFENLLYFYFKYFKSILKHLVCSNRFKDLYASILK